MGLLRVNWRHIILHILLIMGGIITAFPFLWMIATSLKGPDEVFSLSFSILPRAWNFNNYPQVFEILPFGRFYLNTIIVTVARTIGQVLICAMAGYAFAKLRFPGKNFLFVAVLAIMMLPSQITLIPNYILLKYIHWIDTYQGLIIPSLFSAFGTFLLRQFFMTLPSEIDDAAKLDGCNPLQTFIHIALPLARPGLVAFAVLVVLWSWNDFLWPLIITNSTNMQMLSVGISYFQNPHVTNYALIMAAASLTILPIMIIFIISQRLIIEGITMTGLKM
jgi:multiple sugar transport system permease protein